MAILLNSANASLIPGTCLDISWQLINCKGSFERAYPEVIPENRNPLYFHMYVVYFTGLIRKSGYNFLTCYYYDYRSWQYYLEPFKVELWIALISYLILLAIYIHVSLAVRNQNKSDLNPYFFLYSTLLEYASLEVNINMINLGTKHIGKKFNCCITLEITIFIKYQSLTTYQSMLLCMM